LPGAQVPAQAADLAYIDAFWVLTWALMLISAAAVPLALILRKMSSVATQRASLVLGGIGGILSQLGRS
jgi:hypothetical protein